ncbi:unnamed protein product, partial [Ostreobium quekettii]
MAFICCSCRSQLAVLSEAPVFSSAIFPRELWTLALKDCVMVTEEPHIKVIAQASHDVEGSLALFMAAAAVTLALCVLRKELQRLSKIEPT